VCNAIDPLEQAVYRYVLRHTTLDKLEAGGRKMSESSTPEAQPQPDMCKPQRVKTLEVAIALTAGDRNRAYGPPYYNLSDCARLWNAYLAIRGGRQVDAEAVAWMNVLQKIARSCQPGYHPDNYTDAAAYSAIAGECREQEETNKWT
jgi:hypothetical protein